MYAGARTPEELETLCEDAFVLHDARALHALFEPRVAMGRGDGGPPTRGRVEVIRAVSAMWAREEIYLAAPMQVLQADHTALIATAGATSVARRSRHGTWRYALSLLHPQPSKGAQHE